jgi:hypothetical protein
LVPAVPFVPAGPVGPAGPDWFQLIAVSLALHLSAIRTRPLFGFLIRLQALIVAPEAVALPSTERRANDPRARSPTILSLRPRVLVIKSASSK